MAPFKEERGESPKATRHTLYSMSTQVAGGWINHTLVHEILYVPETTPQVQGVGQGNGSQRHGQHARLRQASFEEWVLEQNAARKTQEATPPTKEEEGCVENPGSSGSRPTTTQQSESPKVDSKRSRWASRQHSGRSLENSLSPSTHPKISPRQASPTHKTQATDFEESSAKSGPSAIPSTRNPRLKSSASQQDSSSGKSTKPGSRSRSKAT